jgi:parallel beta-helix repeat protein
MLIVLGWGCSLSPQLRATVFYVSQAGSPAGNGTQQSPWDLQTALNQPASVVPPGSAVCLEGATPYQGRFTSTLQGSASALTKVVPCGHGFTIDGFGGNTITSSILAGNANTTVSFTVSSAYVAQQYTPNSYVKVGTETFQVTAVNSNSVTAIRGQNISCPSGQNTCPAESVGTPVTLQTNTLTINGSYVMVENGEFLYSGWISRVSEYGGYNPFDEENNAAVFVNGPNNRLVNNRIHDNGEGIVLETNAGSTTLSGNIIGNNGWISAAGIPGYGKDILSFTAGFTQSISNNLLMPTYGAYAMDAITQNTDPAMAATFSKNLIVNGSVYLGGYGPIQGLTVNSNTIFNSVQGQVVIGTLSNQVNAGLTFASNNIASFLPTLFKYWKPGTIHGNSFCNINPAELYTLERYLYETTGVSSDYNFTKNTYCNPAGNSTAILFDSWDAESFPVATSYSFPAWQQTLRYDPNSTELSSTPAATVITLSPNSYNSESANLSVNNWTLVDTVQVDLTALNWPLNSTVTLLNAENPAETMILVAAGQVITVPMTGWTAAIPTEATAPVAPSTYPDFGVWIVTRN